MKTHNFMRIGMLDPAPLLARLAARSDLWQAGARERFPGSPHAQASSIKVRWVPLLSHEDAMAAFIAGAVGLKTEGMVDEILNSTEAVDYPAGEQLMPEVGAAVMSVLEPLGVIGNLGHVMLTRLPVGGRIALHQDEGAYSELFDRFHVCLAGGGGNVFHCGAEAYSPKPGEIFWFNHKLPHEVLNLDAYGHHGGAERIHLIVDVMAPAFTAKRGRYYQLESVADLWDEVQPLFAEHYREIAHFQDIALAPDQHAYFVAQESGQLRCYTLRDCGRLVGYAFFFVKRNMHYAGSLQANQDLLYVAPAYRKGWAGLGLIRHAEARLRAEGVQVVYHHAKRTNRVGELMVRLGYELVDEIYAKRLDKKG